MFKLAERKKIGNCFFLSNFLSFFPKQRGVVLMLAEIYCFLSKLGLRLGNSPITQKIFFIEFREFGK